MFRSQFVTSLRSGSLVLFLWPLFAGFICGQALASFAGPLFPGPTSDVGNDPLFVAIGDFNGDGKLDLAVADGAVSVLLNIGAMPVGAVPGREPHTARFLASVPNPAHGATTISFDAPTPEMATLNSLDLSGRITRALSSGARYPAGRNSLIWDGKNDGGQPVASGVYFLQLRAGGQRDTRKILMLR